MPMLKMPGSLESQRLPNAVAVVMALKITARVSVDSNAARTGAVGCISRSRLRRLRVGGVGAVTRPVVGSFDEGSNESLLVILHCRPG